MSTCESVGLSNQVSLSLKSYIIIINVFLNVQKNGINERPAYLKIVVRIYLQTLSVNEFSRIKQLNWGP